MSDLDDLETIADQFAPVSLRDTPRRSSRRAKTWAAKATERRMQAIEASRYRRCFYGRSNSEPRSPGTGERGSE